MTDTELVTIAADGISAAISPFGAELQRLQDGDGRDLLWDGDPAFWSGRAPVLFPIVGALAGDSYRLGGRRYALPKHGFARRSRFALLDRHPHEATFRLDASAETRAAYPFEFRLEMRFAVSAGAIAMTATVANRGDTAMPASFGFHPALRWPLPYGRPRADHRITFAAAEPAPIRRIDADGLVTPDRHASPVDGRTLRLDDRLFVDDAIIFDSLVSRRLVYGAAEGPRLAIDFPDMPLLGLWMKPGAGYICIEPWQGIADPVSYGGDFPAKPAIVAIAPGAARRFAMTISIEQD